MEQPKKVGQNDEAVFGLQVECRLADGRAGGMSSPAAAAKPTASVEDGPIRR